MSEKRSNFEPRISNRKAFHEFHIDAKLECGIVLVGSEVKAVRQGKVTLNDAFARVEDGQLVLHNCHIDVYDKASYLNHAPVRERRLLAHRREIKKLEAALAQKGTTLIPLAMYFKKGMVKIELGLARGKQAHDKRDAIKKKEQDRELRREMSKRQ